LIVLTADGSVVHEVRYPHPIARVWNAIVDPDALAQWLMPNDFEPRVGHRFRFDAGEPRGFFDVEVVEFDEPRRIRWRWFLDDVATTVTIDLRPDGDGTVLNLVHSDLAPDTSSGFDTGWVEKFEALELVVKERA
jgi:uncharacterized protein YndB with AHSA1/START domain